MIIFFRLGTRILCLFISFFFIAACVSKKDITYFQNDVVDQSQVSNNYQTIFKPDDLLAITISALDLEAVKPFNISSGGLTSGSQLLFLVDSKGQIDFPVLGKLKIAGFTREQTIQILKDRLDPDYVKNPSVNITITNFKITVLGDVRIPGTFAVPNERITILEAIGLAGDTNISAQRNNVMVTREENGAKNFYRVDLRSNNIFTSPVYYLQQNDMIYVEQNNAKIQSAASNASIGLYFSVTTILITLLTFALR